MRSDAISQGTLAFSSAPSRWTSRKRASFPKLAEHTKDLDIGLVVSNAGTANPGEFLKLDRQLLEEPCGLHTMSHFRHRTLLRPEAR